MKKLLITILIVIYLFNFILCNNAYADGDEKTEEQEVAEAVTPESTQELMDGDSEDSSSSSSIMWSTISGVLGVIAATIVIVLNIIPFLGRIMMNLAVKSKVTIEAIVFNEIPMFDINYFDFGINDNTTINESIKTSVAKYFIIFRLVAIGVNLAVLVYIGIRMALSILAQDKAKYKKMLMGWFESIIILALLQYIIALLYKVSDTFVQICCGLKDALESSGGSGSFETNTINTISNALNVAKGWTYVMNSVAYWVLLFVQIKYFIMYYKRLIVVGFLIVISPFIAIIYPIDKAGDQKAQSFWKWFKEISMNIFIQPIHALIYLVFMYSAGEIANYSMIFAIIILLLMTKVEKMIFSIFDLKRQSIASVHGQKFGKK